MATVKYFLEQIGNEDIKSKALNNARLQRGLDHDGSYCVHQALWNGFVWDNTPEGFEFWLGVYNSYLSDRSNAQSDIEKLSELAAKIKNYQLPNMSTKEGDAVKALIKAEFDMFHSKIIAHANHLAKLSNQLSTNHQNH